MQNCVGASYDDGAGRGHACRGPCVNAAGIPRSFQIDKSCDPAFEAVPSGPDDDELSDRGLSGTDLATGSFVLVADMFWLLCRHDHNVTGRR